MRQPFAIKSVPKIDNICCLVDRSDGSQLPEVAILLNILLLLNTYVTILAILFGTDNTQYQDKGDLRWGYSDSKISPGAGNKHKNNKYS